MDMGSKENIGGKAVVADLCRLIGTRLDQILDGKHERDWVQRALDRFRVAQTSSTTTTADDKVKWVVPIFAVVHQDTKASIGLAQVDEAISYLNSIPEKERVQPGVWSILWDRLFSWNELLKAAIQANGAPIAVDKVTKKGRKRPGLEFDHKVTHRADFNPFAIGNMEKFSDITRRAEREAQQKDEEEPFVAGLTGSRERRAERDLAAAKLREVDSETKEAKAELREAIEELLYFEGRTDDIDLDKSQNVNVDLSETMNGCARPAGRCAVCGGLIGDSPHVRLVPVAQAGNAGIPRALPDATAEICEACAALPFWTVPNPLYFKVMPAPGWYAALTAVERQVVFLKEQEQLAHIEIVRRMKLPGAHTVTRILQAIESKRAAFYRGNVA